MILIGISGSIGSRPVIIGGDGGGLQWDIDIGRRHRTSCRRILGTFCLYGSGVILMVILIVISIITVTVTVITVRIILFQAT